MQSIAFKKGDKVALRAIRVCCQNVNISQEGRRLYVKV